MYSGFYIERHEYGYLVVSNNGRVFGSYKTVGEAKMQINHIAHWEFNENDETKKSKDELKAEQTRMDRKEKLNRIFND